MPLSWVSALGAFHYAINQWITDDLPVSCGVPYHTTGADWLQGELKQNNSTKQKANVASGFRTLHVSLVL